MTWFNVHLALNHLPVVSVPLATATCATGSADWSRRSALPDDPRFGHDRAHFFDGGVIILPAGSTAGITPVDLPAAGYLDERAAQGGLRGQLFEGVGYGVEAFFRQGPPRYSQTLQRLYAESPFMALQPTWLGLLTNANATGKGGDCLGDSGSPKFVAGTNMIVATVTWGDRICRATSWDWRLDTEEARSFLAGYVTLP